MIRGRLIRALRSAAGERANQRPGRAADRPIGRRSTAGRLFATTATVAASALVMSGCYFFPIAQRAAVAPPEPLPWFCSAGATELTRDDCNSMGAQLDIAYGVALAHLRGADALAAGATASPYEAGVGARFVLRPPSGRFSQGEPDTLLYDGTGPDAQLAGLEWNVTGPVPAGFVGDLDQWQATGPDLWTLRLWIVRPFENRVDPFASSHPCLEAAGPVYDVTAACYQQTHPEPLEILVTNDDGYAAAGIDAVVEALRALPNVEVMVVAPATNQSGSSDKTTPDGVTSFAGQTLSGHPAVAVNGYPADSVVHALNVLRLTPDLVVSGINEGQNIGPIVDLSGTVGAARQAVAHGVPALAVSGGSGADFGQEGYEDVDYEAAVPIVVQWVEMRLESIRDGSLAVEVSNLNVPTCATGGQVRGLLELEVAHEGPALDGQDCTSTLEDPPDDVTAFVNGFATLTVLPDEPANPPEAVVPGDS